MTILFLSRRFYSDIGGVEKHVFEIGKRLVKENNRVVVVTQSQGKEEEIQGIEIKRIKTPGNWFDKFYVWRWLWDNKTLIKTADVIHAHDVYFWYLPFRFIYPTKPTFITFHGYESYPIKKRAIFMRKISEKLSNGNIIVGDFIKKWYGTKPNFVIYGGVDIPTKFSKPKNLESAVFIGRLDEQTGILDYAKAADLVKQKIPNFEFAIVGDGKYLDALRRLKPLGFRNNPEEYLVKYNIAFVSRYLSILEALANKRLVFALFDNPVKEDYLKISPFSKFIVIENSPEKLAERVEYYLNHKKEADKLIEQGFSWVKTKTWDDVLKTYKKLWQISP